MSEMIDLGQEVFASLETGNVFQFTDTKYSRTAPDTLNKGDHKIIKWGQKNLMPYDNRQVLAENDIKQNLINADVNFTAGQYLYLYTQEVKYGKRVITPVDDVQLEDWMQSFRVHEQMTEMIQDIKEFGQSWIEFLLSRDRSIVTSAMVADAVDCRLTKNAKDSIRRDSETLCIADWKYPSLVEGSIQSVPLLDIRNPTLGRDSKCALHVKQIVSGMPYYNLVEWYGTKDWADIANIIPKFHKQGIANGYMLRYHIKIPKSYFDGKSGETLKKAKEDVREELDKVLGSAEDAHKAFISFVDDKVQLGGGSPAEWKFEKIETDLKDESYLKLHETASMVHARGHNLDPALAGFEPQGRMSSGSEMKNKINIHIQYKTTRTRRIVLRPFELIKNFNFPDKRNIHIGIGDMDFTTLDQNESGTEAKLSTP